MENRIEAALSAEDRDKVLSLIEQIRALMPFLIDLSPEDRRALVKMGDKSRAFVEGSLTLAEADNSFLPRSFEVAEMRQDKDLYDALAPVITQFSRLFEALEDTQMLIGSDLIMAAFEVYGNAGENGTGAHLDNLVPLLGRRFSRKSKPKSGDGDGSNPPPSV